MTNNSLPHSNYEQYRGLRALLLTRVSTSGQSHDAQERVIREKLIEPLGLIVNEERHVIHDTYTGLEYRYREALDKILQMAERKEFDVLCLDVLDRGLGRKGVSREVFRGQLRELGIHILTTEPTAAGEKIEPWFGTVQIKVMKEEPVFDPTWNYDGSILYWRYVSKRR